MIIPHDRIRHHRGAAHKKTSLRGQYPVQKLEIFRRAAYSKAICSECRCRRCRAEGYRERFGRSTHALVRLISLTLAQPGSSRDVLFLTADEELLLVRHYLAKVVQLCSHFRFPEEVEATATTYIKRFYLANTVMDWHPKNVMCGLSNGFSVLFTWLTPVFLANRLTALFLATKTTNNPISLDSYAAHIPRTEPTDVLELEFLVAQSLGFDFAVWHPHRALWGAWLDFQVSEARKFLAFAFVC